MASTRAFVESTVPFQGSRAVADVLAALWSQQHHHQDRRTLGVGMAAASVAPWPAEPAWRQLLAAVAVALDAYSQRRVWSARPGSLGPTVSVAEASDRTVAFWPVFNQV